MTGDSTASTGPGPGALPYVALGDSYTIGTATRAPHERWPDQLVERLGPTPPTLRLVANLAVNGFTSRDVVDVELPQLPRHGPEFASLLVGVNDVVRAVPIERYALNVETILDALGERLAADRIVAVSTPDYTVTPRGAEYGDPAAQADGIRRANEVLAAAAAARGMAFVDIHDLSLRAEGDPSLVADDGLHPSGAQYRLWVDRIAPAVATLLGRDQRSV
ncbi:MAG TPA: SGNH/GDSL hydrolase family protein [Candidatus Limnocylindrales bacterium]|nr:SGNH/GDSL hydrolase family protein [Candidatus Limnocylindrales bacterium]